MEESTLSGSYELNINVPVSSKLNITGNFPYRNSIVEFDFGFRKFEEDNSGFGNIFLGIQTRPEYPDDGNSFITAGVFLPTAEERTADFGTDYYHLQRFLPSSLSLYFNYAFHKRSSEYFVFGLEAGPDIIIPTEGKSRNSEVFMHYGGTGGVQIKKFMLNIELTGIAILTADIEDFLDRFVNQIGFGAHWKEELFSAKVFYRLFLRDEFANSIDGILGIGISVAVD